MTLRLVVFIAIVIALCVGVVWASGALEHDFDVANDLYQKGDYDGAIESYLAVLSGGVDNAALHYNLGNAYFKTGRLGIAIACYHRALRLEPRNDDIRANLEFARQYLVDKVDPTAQSPIWMWYKSLVLFYTTDEWAVLSSCLLFLSAVVLAYMIWTRRRTVIVKAILSALLVMLICAGICTGVNAHFGYYAVRGAIIVPEVSVRAGPGEDFDEQFLAHEGLTFDILKQESGWYFGIFDNRLKGWIKLTDAVKI
jgi:tetratricopeptide (TPR) repeat protein